MNEAVARWKPDIFFSSPFWFPIHPLRVPVSTPTSDFNLNISSYPLFSGLFLHPTFFVLLCQFLRYLHGLFFLPNPPFHIFPIPSLSSPYIHLLCYLLTPSTSPALPLALNPQYLNSTFLHRLHILNDGPHSSSLFLTPLSSSPIILWSTIRKVDRKN